MNQISFQTATQVSTSQAFKLGQRAMTPDGREWQYIKAVSAIAKGNAVVPNAVVSVDLVSSSTDSLGRRVFITKASAGWTVGQFEDGIGVVDDGTGVGQTFKIKSNSTDTLELYPESALATALSVVDSDITIMTMSYVTKSAVTSKLQMCQGISQVAFATGDFGWALTDGDGAVITGNTLVVGAGFTTGDDTVGQVIVSVITEAPLTAQNLGYDIVANAAADQSALVRAFIR
jgi:hypothetical protein